MVWFSHPSLLQTNYFVALVRSSFTHGKISAGMTRPATPVTTVTLMFSHLSLTSLTFPGNTQELFATLSNDSWASFFNFIFGSLLMTSCHLLVLALLQQTPRMQLIFIFAHFVADVSFVFANSVQTPVPTPPWCNLTQFDAMCPVFPQLQQTLVSPLPPFACPFLLSRLQSWIIVSFFPTLFTFAAVEVSHSSWVPFLYSIHFWLLFPCTMLALRVLTFFCAVHRKLPRHRFLRPCRSPLVHSCQCSSLWMPHLS